MSWYDQMVGREDLELRLLQELGKVPSAYSLTPSQLMTRLKLDLMDQLRTYAALGRLVAEGRIVAETYVDRTRGKTSSGPLRVRYRLASEQPN